MKNYSGIWIVAVFVLINAQLLWAAPSTVSQPAPGQTQNVPSPTPYAITAQDGNSRVWERTTYELDPSGQAVPKTHSYNELATGLNHLVNGRWVESSEQIDILPNGTAAATNGQHQAYFPGDIYQGEIELVTPDGQHLHSRPMGLSYFDGTNSVLIAELTNSIGVVTGNNRVVYPNAFTDFAADLRYTYTKAGFEQDIILREQPPTPESLGLNPDTARLEVLTEFFSPPQPQGTARTVTTAAGDLEDDNLTFGTMAMIPGKAFMLGTNSPSVSVNKQWVTLSGRQFLVEEVPVVSIADGLQNLPVPQAQAAPVSSTRSNSPLNVVSAKRLLPAQRLAKTVPAGKPMQITRASTASQGLVLDYMTVNGTFTNYTFHGDVTYYFSGAAYLWGTNTFEGGAVLKYANGASLMAEPGYFLVAVNWLASAYHPVVFTAKDDNSVGEILSGSTGTPSGYYANPALGIIAPNVTPTISYFRIAYAQQAILLNSVMSGAYHIYDGQIVNCQNGFTALDGANAYFRNMLFGNVQAAIDNPAFANIDVQNSTFSSSSYLTTVNSGYQSVNPSFTNCLFVNVSNLTNNPSLPYLTYQISGDHNGFYNSPGFGTSQVTNTFFPFQSAGGGNYYLANGTTFTNAGTTNIDPVLLASLKQKTTYPPIVYSNIVISATTLSPQAQRDTDTPDLGYHYDPIDYALGGVDLYTNLNVASGTVVCWFDSQGGVYSYYQGYGISLNDGASLSFQGTATLPCWMVKYDTVQERFWTTDGYMGGIMINGSASGVHPQLNGRFTKFSALDADSHHYRDAWAYGTSSFANCEFYISSIEIYDESSVTFTNCLFFRAGVYFDGYNQPNIPSMTFQNCLFYNGFMTMNRYAGQPTTVWTIKDTAFDGTGFSTTDNLNGNPTYTAFDHNAYNTNNQSGLSYSYPYTPPPTNRLENIGAHDVFVGNYNWQASWLGNYYQPTNSPLINMGSTTADQVGLYHFTTQTNQVKETNSIVDIGYHYVATDAFGNPLDSNGDGIPDYLEDANGNGLVDSGEIGWNITGDLGLQVIITRPRNGSILP